MLAARQVGSTGPAALASLLAAVAGSHAADIDRVTVDLSEALYEVLRASSDVVGHAAPRVAAVRILPRAAQLDVLSCHPDRLIEGLVGRRHYIPGGHDLFGRELLELDRTALEEVCDDLDAGGFRTIAVTGCGSQSVADHEVSAAEAMLARIPTAQVWMAHEFGGQGLLAREATIVLNAALVPAAEHLLNACEEAVRSATPGALLGVMRGDGGWVLAARMRMFPVLGFASTSAAEVLAGARLAGYSDCRVHLPRPSGSVTGEVRGGSVVVEPHQWGQPPVELVVPTAALLPGRLLDVPACASAGGSPNGGRDPELGRQQNLPLIRTPPSSWPPGDDEGHAVRPQGPQRAIEIAVDPPDLVCVGAAISQPTAWLDEIVHVHSAAELEQVRRDAQEQVAAMVTALGADPGTVEVVETSVMAMAYSPSGTVRVRVRAVGTPDLRGAGAR